MARLRNAVPLTTAEDLPITTELEPEDLLALSPLVRRTGRQQRDEPQQPG